MSLIRVFGVLVVLYNTSKTFIPNCKSEASLFKAMLKVCFFPQSLNKQMTFIQGALCKCSLY